MKKIRHEIETALIRFGAWWVPQLSRQTVLWLGKICGAISYVIDYRGRANAHENLRVAFAREHITPSQVRWIALKSYQTFACTFFDLFWSVNLTKEHLSRYVNIIFEDPRTEEIARERGSIWVTPHFGNFELVSLAVGFRGFGLVVVAQDFKNTALTDIFKQLRQMSGHMIIPQQGAMLRLTKELKRGGHTAMLCDLNIKPGRSAAVIECFGLKTCVPTLHCGMSQRLNLPMILSVCRLLSDGTYRSLMRTPMAPKDFATSEEMTQAAWNWFEAHIRETPEAWLWMYKHWRYLPGTEQDPRYPAYANPNKAFQKMITEAGKGKGADVVPSMSSK